MIPRQKHFTLAIAEDPAFAPHGLGQQTGRAGGEIQRGGVKLHKFHIFQDSPCPVRHGHAIARRIVHVGGPGVHLSRPARCQEHAGCREDLHVPRDFIHHNRAITSAVHDQQVPGKMTVEPSNVRLLSGAFQQHANDFMARCVALGPQDTASAVRAFCGKGKLSADLVKFRAPGDEFLNTCRPFLYQDARRVFPTKLMSGPNRIGEMQVHIIFGLQGNGDASLGVHGVALEPAAFCHNEDMPETSQLNRRAQSRNPASDDEKIGLWPPAIWCCDGIHGLTMDTAWSAPAHSRFIVR